MKPAGQHYGEVFTRRWVVEVLLDLARYTTDRDLGVMTLVEPSAGSGAFLLPALERLMVSATKHHRSLANLGGAVRAWELQAGHIHGLRGAVVDVLAAHGVESQRQRDSQKSG